jgi:hypothetical protein
MESTTIEHTPAIESTPAETTQATISRSDAMALMEAQFGKDKLEEIKKCQWPDPKAKMCKQLHTYLLHIKEQVCRYQSEEGGCKCVIEGGDDECRAHFILQHQQEDGSYKHYPHDPNENDLAHEDKPAATPEKKETPINKLSKVVSWDKLANTINTKSPDRSPFKIPKTPERKAPKTPERHKVPNTPDRKQEPGKCSFKIAEEHFGAGRWWGGHICMSDTRPGHEICDTCAATPEGKIHIKNLGEKKNANKIRKEEKKKKAVLSADASPFAPSGIFKPILKVRSEDLLPGVKSPARN